MIALSALLSGVLAFVPGTLHTDFNGPQGVLPPPWEAIPCPLARGQITGDCPARNARVMGDGTLRLAASAATGSLIQTKRTFRAPFHLRVRMKMPRAGGYWPTVWLTRTDSPVDAWELDMEPRTGRPGEAACYQHKWNAGRKTTQADTVDGRVRLWRWHTWQINARRRGTTYSVDGRRCLIADPIQGTYRIHIQTIGALPGTWVAGCNMPVIPCALPGAQRPDESRVDWVDLR